MDALDIEKIHLVGNSLFLRHVNGGLKPWPVIPKTLKKFNMKLCNSWP